MKKLILINGLKRSGKDYVGNVLTEIIGKENVSKFSFAGPLKEIVAKTFDISLEDLELYKNESDQYGLEVKAYPNNQEPVNIKYTDFRTILQRFGTEAMKPIFGNNIWAKIAMNNVIKSNKEYNIITDFRFLSEYNEALINSNEIKIITLNIINKDLKNKDFHSSETELQDNKFTFDFVIDNTGHSPVIKEKVTNFLKSIKD